MKSLFYLLAVTMLSAAFVSCSHHKTNLIGADTLKTIHNNGVNIAYTDTGKNDTTLLFVHGWAINKGYWQDQMEYFGKRYRVVAMDLPGFGQSGKNRKEWDTKTFASDVDSVIKALDLKKVILIGHSMSGDIVLQSAIDNPTAVIGLVGVDNFKNPGQPVTEQSKKEFEAAMAQMKLHFKAVATAYFNQTLFSKTTTAPIRKRILDDVNRADSVIAIASMADGNDFKEIDKLKEAKKELYLINSDIQPLDSTYLIASKIPYKVYYIHGSGHYPMIEHPQKFNQSLDKVIGDIDKAKL
ncbi:MAG: alpha/beta hydrolase [Bacteroidota bacterium]